MRPFSYSVKTQAQSATIPITAAFGTNFGYVTLIPENYFLLTSFRAYTNYDNFGGKYTTASSAAILVSPPFVPNNFTVQIARGQSNTYSNLELTQPELCSTGYQAGKQLPQPVVYGPRFNFAFTFNDLTGLVLNDAAAAAIPLRIQMQMVGYKIPIKNWDRFLNYFPYLGNVLTQ